MHFVYKKPLYIHCLYSNLTCQHLAASAGCHGATEVPVPYGWSCIRRISPTSHRWNTAPTGQEWGVLGPFPFFLYIAASAATAVWGSCMSVLQCPGVWAGHGVSGHRGSCLWLVNGQMLNIYLSFVASLSLDPAKPKVIVNGGKAHFNKNSLSKNSRCSQKSQC